MLTSMIETPMHLLPVAHQRDNSLFNHKKICSCRKKILLVVKEFKVMCILLIDIDSLSMIKVVFGLQNFGGLKFLVYSY